MVIKQSSKSKKLTNKANRQIIQKLNRKTINNTKTLPTIFSITTLLLTQQHIFSLLHIRPPTFMCRLHISIKIPQNPPNNSSYKIIKIINLRH